MKPETERLLQQCRATLLQYSVEQLNMLFLSWFERMIGDEYIDETLDDLCLLLGYKIRSTCSNILYATYTAWWEVEGYTDPDCEFVCVDTASLQHQLITMPIKEFNLISELAYQVCQNDAELDGVRSLPTGQDWLRQMAAWLSNGASEPFHKQSYDIPTPTPTKSSQRQEQQQQQLTRKQRQAQQRKIESRLVDQAWNKGYLLLDTDVNNQIITLVQSRCKKNRRPYISVQVTGSQFASIQIDLVPIRKAFDADRKLFSGAPEPNFMSDNEIRERLTAFAEQYIVRSMMPYAEPPFALSPRRDILTLNQVSQENVPQAVQDFMTLWPDMLAHYEKQLAASRVAYEIRQRELEEERKPTWLKTITRLSKPGQEATACPETIILPADWPALLSKEQLGAFLTFLKLPASSREIKTNLVQHLLTYMESNKTVLAQLLEVFVIELAVPPWEIETLLKCTTTERKRWTEEGKLPILDYGSFRKGGSNHEYAIYDRRIILALTSDDLARWRNEHQAIVRERRSIAARAAAASRKAKRAEAQPKDVELAHES